MNGLIQNYCGPEQTDASKLSHSLSFSPSFLLCVFVHLVQKTMTYAGKPISQLVGFNSLAVFLCCVS